MSARAPCASSSGCTNASAPGKRFCVFHRKEAETEGAGAEAQAAAAPPPVPIPVPVPASAVAASHAAPAPVPAAHVATPPRMLPQPPKQPPPPPVAHAASATGSRGPTPPPMPAPVPVAAPVAAAAKAVSGSPARPPQPPPPPPVPSHRSAPPSPAMLPTSSAAASPPSLTGPTHSPPKVTPVQSYYSSSPHANQTTATTAPVAVAAPTPFSPPASHPPLSTPSHSSPSLHSGSATPPPAASRPRKASFGSRLSAFGDALKNRVEQATGTGGGSASSSSSGAQKGNSVTAASAPSSRALTPELNSMGHTQSYGSMQQDASTLPSSSLPSRRASPPEVSYARLPPSSRFSPQSAASASASLSQPSPGGGGTATATVSASDLQFHHFPHAAEGVLALVEAGLYVVHRVAGLWGKELKAEEEAAKTTIKALEHEMSKTGRTGAGVGIGGDASMTTTTTTGSAWVQFQRLQLDLATRSLDLCARKHSFALQPLEYFHFNALARVKELEKLRAQREKEMLLARAAANKELAQCERIMEGWKKCKAEEEGVGRSFQPSAQSSSPPASSSSSKEKAGALFSKLSAKLSSAQKPPPVFSSSSEALGKLLPSASRYAELLAACNRREESYRSGELREFLQEVQRVEVERVEALAKAMATWVKCEEEAAGEEFKHYFHTGGSDIGSTVPASALSLSSSSSSSSTLGLFPRLIGQLDVHADMESAVRSLAEAHGLAPAWAPTPWGLGASLDEIRSGRIGSNANSLFHRSLAELMEAQSASPPHRHLPVPRFLLYLLSAIRSSQGGRGVAEEGVFRISPSKEELEAWKKQLDALGVESVQRADVEGPAASNVFLACALLKDWLRGLTESLVPREEYMTAIDIAKQAQTEEAAMLAAGVPNAHSTRPLAAPVASALDALLSSLPPPHHHALCLLSDLLSEVASPLNQVSNRMTPDNLAMIFAPCVLRSPGDLEPGEIMQNSKFEIKFASLLFRRLSDGEPTLARWLDGLQ